MSNKTLTRLVKFTIRFLAATLLCWSWSTARAVESLDFASAVQYLDTRNERISASQHHIQGAQSQFNEALGRRWPSLTLDGRLTRINAPLNVDLDPLSQLVGVLHPGFPAALIPAEYTLQKQQFGNLGITATWPIYTGGRIQAGIDAASAAHAASVATGSATSGELRLELVQRYFGQRLAEEAVAVRQMTVDGLKRHVADAFKLEQQGQIARAERLRAEVALAEAQRDMETARSDRALASAALAALLASDELFETITAIPELPALPELSTLLKRAVEANPKLSEARFQHRRAEAGVRASKGDKEPSLALFAQRELYTRDLTILQPEWALGVALNWQLFDAGQRDNRIAAARAQADEVQALVNAGRRDVELLVRQRYQNLANAHTVYGSYAQTRALAEESLRMQQRAFAEGIATSLDVVDAELALSRVSLGMLATRYAGIIALAGLYEATGDSSQITEMVRTVQAIEPTVILR